MQTAQRIHHTLSAYLAKSSHGHGEGSRGGHVIGHTKSGRPIYGHGGTFHPHDAHFDEAGDGEGLDHEATTEVPLGGGFTARYRAVADDAEHVDPEDGYADGDWDIHGPDGKPSNTHKLDASFYDHPEAKRIAAETEHQARKNAASFLEGQADASHERTKYGE